MIASNNQYSLRMFANGTEISFGAEFFRKFVIYEILEYGFPIYELHLDGSLLKSFTNASSQDYSFELTIYDDKTYKIDTVLYSYKTGESKNNYAMTFIPTAIDKMNRDKQTVAFNARLGDMIDKISLKFGIEEKEIENVTTGAISLIKFNQGYTSFMRDLCEYASNGSTASYLYFIDKNKKMKFYSYNHIMNKKAIDTIPENGMMMKRIDDKTYALQAQGGFGGVGYSFNWDTGEMESVKFGKKDFEKAKIGVKISLIDEANNTMPLISSAKFYKEDTKTSNKAKLESFIMRKNIFNVFVSFYTNGNYLYSAGEKVTLFFMDFDGSNDSALSGDYITYAVNHVFDKEGYKVFMENGRPFYKVEDSQVFY
jgi:hypothetical protein